jgi:iron complex outermembrane receptor protein
MGGKILVRTSRHSVWLASALATVWPVIGEAQLAAAAPAAIAERGVTEGEPADMLADIVVTAQRREESLQRVPIAITALNAEALQSRRVTTIENLSGLAPSLTIGTASSGSSPTISLRGIGSGASQAAIDPKVALYLDGVYIGRSIGSIFGLADLERVEVLRGPQGTLFGRNATAGAISLITAPPTGEFSVSQLASYGNYDALRLRTVVNLPALGPLSIKVAYLHDEIAGDVRNLLAGQTIDVRPRDPRFGPFTYAARLGERNEDAIQVGARLDLESVVLDYRFDHTDSRTTARAQQILSKLSDGGGTLAAGLIDLQALTGGITNFSPDRLDAVAAGTSREHTTVSGHSLTATWHASDAITFKSITAFRQLKQRPFIYDLAGSAGLRFTLQQFYALLAGDIAGVVTAPPPGINDNLNTLIVARDQRQKQFTQELQFVLSTDKIDLTAGVFYFKEKAPTTDVSGVFQPIVNGVASAYPDITLPNGTVIPGLDSIFGSGVTASRTNNDSLAAYAQATYRVTERFDLTGGIRITKDNRRTELVSISGSNGSTLTPGTYTNSYRRVNFTAIAGYRPADQINLYAKVATGYVAGGVVSAIPFGPESLVSYEIGLKSQLWNNRVRLNIAAFYQDYKDLQVQSFTNGVLGFSNAGAARIPGFEVEFTAIPVRGLTINGGLGYSEFNFKEYKQVLSDRISYDVAEFARAPYFSKLTLQFGAAYEFPELAGGGRPFLRIDPQYRSSFFLTSYPASITSVQAAQISAGNISSAIAAQEKLNRVEGFWLVDGRIGIAKLPLGGIDAELSLWGQNLFDVRKATFGASVISLTGQFSRGRTYGVELTARF